MLLSVVSTHLLDRPSLRRRSKPDSVFEAAAPCVLRGTRALRLGAPMTLLCLCPEAVRERPSGPPALRSSYLIARLLEHHAEALGWSRLVEMARELMLTLPLRRVVPEVVRTWAVAMDEDVRRLLDSLEPRAGEAEHFAALIAGPRWRRPKIVATRGRT